MKRGFSVTVACDASSVKEWFDSTHPLKLFRVDSTLAMTFRKRFVKGWIIPGANNLYLGASIGDRLFGILGFANPDYGEYDLLMKADTTPSEWEKSTDLLLFCMRTMECKRLLELKFNREINTIYSMCFSNNQTISRYRKHGKLTSKKQVRSNINNWDEKLKQSAHSKIKYLINTGKVIKTACESCGSTLFVEAHHADYNKPLEIKWLCKKCHDIADGEDETAYKINGYNLGYLFKTGTIQTLKEAKAQFIQKSWKK